MHTLFSLDYDEAKNYNKQGFNWSEWEKFASIEEGDDFRRKNKENLLKRNRTLSEDWNCYLPYGAITITTS